MKNVMEIENYLDRLNSLQPLSPGLRAYLETIAKQDSYTKGKRLNVTSERSNYYALIISGTLKLSATHKETSEEINLGFYLEGDFVPHVGEVLLNGVNDLMLEFLDYSTVIHISERHFSNLLKLFPEAYKLSQSFASLHFGSLLNQLYIRNRYQAKLRYQIIIMERPKLANRISVKDMATFLGIDQKTLSRIRSAY